MMTCGVCTDVAQDMLQVYRMQHDTEHEELQRLQQDAVLQCVCIEKYSVTHSQLLISDCPNMQLYLDAMFFRV